MSKNQMLIDATHPEETRVVVLREGRVEEFDYESAARELLRGNIYLAKVTRVEPSLQAAFIDYGGNRHGFLAFNEIHPDYYQIPIADRQALLDEEAADAVAAAADDDDADANASAEIEVDADVQPTTIGGVVEFGAADDAMAEDDGEAEADADTAQQPDTDTASPNDAALPLRQDARVSESLADKSAADANDDDDDEGDMAEPIDEVGSEDAMEEVPIRPRRHRSRPYKIQEVIKRRQIILVQVVKEERGNKGAAMTTYLSLAGRYTVLMPNTGRGGGISRKISNPADRRRLKKIAVELEVPQGMGLIIRTAGAARNKMEIKRDYEYLLRLWENVRDLTLDSSAPALVYAEGDLIKRSIRDLYGKDVSEVIVAGDESYKNAKDFMRMLMPSHARNVHKYDDPEPLFSKYQIERQLNAMFTPFVTLRSGGYLVINQTEALVAIDVNSGKSTREFSIEETALKTNLEAAEEIARQFKLRDLAGLIVIDFIDMEENRNNRAVEKRVKDCLKTDRARIQVGRISHFGLLEMSRQRLRTGVLEGSTTQCTHCLGTGLIRSTDSVALAILRAIEDALMADGRGDLCATASAEAALYILNNKRAFINEMEARYEVSIQVTASDAMHGPNFAIERSGKVEAAARPAAPRAVNFETTFDQPEGEGEGPRKKPRRRRRRRSRDDQPAETQDSEAQAGEAQNGSAQRDVAEAGDSTRPTRRPRSGDDPQPRIDDEAVTTAGHESDDGDGEERHTARRTRRRGRRGGRRGQDAAARSAAETPDAQNADADADANGGDPSQALQQADRDAPAASVQQHTQPEPQSDQNTSPAARAPAMQADRQDDCSPAKPQETSTERDSAPVASNPDQPAQDTQSKPQQAYSFVPKGWLEVHGNSESGNGASRPAETKDSKVEDTQAPAAVSAPPVVDTKPPRKEPEPAPTPTVEAAPVPEPAPSSPPRRGWWQRSR